MAFYRRQIAARIPSLVQIASAVHGSVCAALTADARALLEELIDDPYPPDANVATSDELALGVLDIIGQRGRRVPGDVTVSGWDDSPAAAHHDLTSVHQSTASEDGLSHHTRGRNAAPCAYPRPAG